MKKIFIILLALAINSFAQTFTVDKVKGTVKVLKGTSEKWIEIKKGDKLDGSDLISTEENSYIQLSKDKSYFKLKANSALGLNSIKKISVNELLLALTAEEVKNVPNNNNSKMKSTAVYGSENNGRNKIAGANNLGTKRINGAKQLAENGYKESAVIAAKETFRKYPETAKNVSDRIYFAQILEDLNLFDEAYSEYSKINSLDLSNQEKNIVKNKLESLTLKISNSSKRN